MLFRSNEIAFLKNQLALLTAQAQRTAALSSDHSPEHSPSFVGRQHGRRPVYERLEGAVAGDVLDKGKGKCHDSPVRHHSTGRRRRRSNRRAKSQTESSFSGGSSLTPCHQKGVPGKAVSEGEPSVRHPQGTDQLVLGEPRHKRNRRARRRYSPIPEGSDLRDRLTDRRIRALQLPV